MAPHLLHTMAKGKEGDSSAKQERLPKYTFKGCKKETPVCGHSLLCSGEQPRVLRILSQDGHTS